MTTILLKTITAFLVNFYSLSFTNVDGNTINMSSYQGKKVLICNIATGSTMINQLSGLQALKNQYGDSLVVIVFPSNSFGHEARTNAQIKQYCQANFNSSFVIASKSNVVNTSTNSIFSWLGSKAQNGDMDAVAGGDFEKFIVNKDGTLLGVFSSKVSPTDPSIIQAITSSF
jgi:glutathione peroxidase